MIIGVGTDSIEIDRIARASETAGFLKKYFTEKELALFGQKKMRDSTIAGNFAGKEAVAKAFGTGFRGFQLMDMEILRDEKGKPWVALHGSAKEIAAQLGIRTVHVSITHDMSYATAFAVAEGDGKGDVFG